MTKAGRQRDRRSREMRVQGQKRATVRWGKLNYFPNLSQSLVLNVRTCVVDRTLAEIYFLECDQELWWQVEESRLGNNKKLKIEHQLLSQIGQLKQYQNVPVYTNSLNVILMNSLQRTQELGKKSKTKYNTKRTKLRTSVYEDVFWDLVGPNQIIFE